MEPEFQLLGMGEIHEWGHTLAALVFESKLGKATNIAAERLDCLF